MAEIMQQRRPSPCQARPQQVSASLPIRHVICTRVLYKSIIAANISPSTSEQLWSTTQKSIRWHHQRKPPIALRSVAVGLAAQATAFWASHTHFLNRIAKFFAGLTWRPGITPEEQVFKAMHVALTSGCNLWNGGEIYGTPDNNSLTLLKKYYSVYPEDADKVVLNIKGATRPGLQPDGSAEYVRESVENCLKMLGERGRIDMFECARRDPKVPLTETLGALAELVEEGKIGGVALSEVSASTIKEAAKVTKIVAVEVELSLWTTDPLTNGIAEACFELDIPIIAYSPIGRGMFTGQIKSLEDLPQGDIRRMLPRFQPQSFETNMKLARELEKIAQKKNCTPAQLALAWVRSLSNRERMPEIIPIPGARSAEKVKENAVEVDLTEEEMKDIDTLLASCEIIGDRYHPEGMTLVNG